METYKITFKQELTVTAEDIDAIVCTALEGGINYWCRKVRPVGDYLGEYASDQISRGGKLVFTLDEAFDESEKTEYTMTQDDLLRGLKMYLSNPESPYDITDYEHGLLVLDPCDIDATVADMIIQYALFNEIVFG